MQLRIPFTARASYARPKAVRLSVALLVLCLLSASLACTAYQPACTPDPWSAPQPMTVVSLAGQTGLPRADDHPVGEPATLVIEQVRYHKACPAGMVYLIGVVENTGSVPVVPGTINVTLREATGRPAGALSIPPPVRALASGERMGFWHVWGPFEIPVTVTWTSLTTEMPRLSIASHSDVPDALQITSVSGEPQGDAAYLISGQLRNVGNEQVSMASVNVTLFDVNGQLVGVGWCASKPRTLGPGATADFEVVISDLAGIVDHYEVHATY